MNLQSHPANQDSTYIQELNVFQFDDPVDVLSACIEYKKRKYPNFTISHWAKKLELPTSGILFNLIKRRRLLTEELAVKIAENLHFDRESTEYFHTLVAWSRAKHSRSKAASDLRSQLLSQKLKRKSVVLNTQNSAELWDFKTLAIKELIVLHPGMLKSEIRSSLTFELSDEAIEKSLQVLIDLKVIQKTSSGGYEALIENMDSETDVPSEKIRAYHRESLDHAKNCLNTIPIESRYFSNYTLPMNQSDLGEAKKDIEKFISEFAAKYEKKLPEGNAIYQINLNFVPLTHTGANTESDIEEKIYET